MIIPKIAFGNFFRKKYITRGMVILCSEISPFLLDFCAKIRKFAWRCPTLNFCAKTVTDRKMQFSPVVHICPREVPIGSLSSSNTNYLAGEDLGIIFGPNFVTCLRWSYSPIPHGQGI